MAAPRRLSRYVGKMLLLAALYLLTGKLGLLLAVPPGYATVIWPPSGIALGMLILHGRRLWPGILLGSFVLNCYISHAYTPEDGLALSKLIAAFGIACGSTLQAWVGHALIRQYVGLPLHLTHIREIFRMFAICGPVTCLIAATAGVGTLHLTGVLPAENIPGNWLAWWMGDLFGILVFLPLMLVMPGSHNHVSWRGRALSSLSALAMLAIILPLGLTFYAWKIASESNYQQSRTQFQSLALESEKALLHRLDSYENALLGGAGFIHGSDHVARAEWREYVNTIQVAKNFPGINGIGWIVPTSEEGLPAFLKKVRADGAPDFTPHPEGHNRPHYVITYIEPQDINAPAVGLDIAFEANRRAAAEKARDSGKAAITQRIILVQDEQKTPGFLLLHPLYKQHMPHSTVAQRQATLRGWVYAPFIAKNFLQSLTRSQSYKINIRVYDGGIESPDTLIYNSSSDVSTVKPAFTERKTLEIMQQKWLVVWESTRAFEQDARSENPLMLLVGGLLFTGLFTLFLMVASIRRQDTIEWMAGERKYTLPITVFLLMSFGSYALYIALEKKELGYIHMLVEDEANKIETLVKSQTNDKLKALKRLAQRWEIAGGTPYKLWQNDAHNYTRDLYGLTTVEWVDASYHVRWVEPLQGNEKAVGLNILFNAAREESLKGAAKRNAPTLTPPLDLVQGYKAFIAYLPLKTDEKFDGFIAGIFSIAEFFGGATTKELGDHYALEISYEGRTHFASNEKSLLGSAEWMVERRLPIYDKLWKMRITPTQQFIRDQQTLLPISVLIAGLLIAALSALSVRTILISRLRAYYLEASRNALEISSRRHQQLVNGVPDYAIYWLDPHGNIESWNSGAELIKGYAAQEVIGQHFSLFYTDADRAKHLPQKALEMARREGKYEAEGWRICKNGKRFWASVVLAPLLDTDGTLTGYAKITRDITERKEYEKALQDSEERYDLAVRGMSVGLWDWNVQTDELYWSERFKEIIGITEVEFHPHYNEFVVRLHPDDKDDVISQLMAHVETGSPYNVEYRLKHHNGHYVWIHAFGQAKWGEDGKAIRMAGSVNDITEVKRQQEALKISEETFRSAMESASIGMALVQPDGRWLTVNPALCTLLGYSREELLANDFQSITHPEDLGGDLEMVSKVLNNELPAYQLEKRYYHKSGRIIWALLNVSLVRYADGRPNYFIAQIQDITERKEMERIKSEFISIVSHELRTPLTSIRGSLGLILGAMAKDLPTKVKGLIDIAHNNCERLILLINDILDIDKIASGQMRFDIKEESLAEITQHAVEANESYAQKFNVRIDLAPIDPALRIMVDVSRYIQILSNLLSNAAKFSPANGVVEVATQVHKDRIRITVTDHGPGIPEEFHSRIFGKFSQADSSVTRTQGGTGLGLHITQQIVARMQGKIGFDTVLNQGTTFWVDFPLPHKLLLSDSNLEDSNPILICEGDQTLGKQMATILREASFTADIATDISQAWALLQRKSYAAMTLDSTITDDDFIHKLRTNDTTRNLPVIMVTENAGIPILPTDHGSINTSLCKPVDAKQLVTAVKNALRAQHQLPTILHIEDDADLTSMLASALQDKAVVVAANSLHRAEIALKQGYFDLVLLDIGMPDGSGLTMIDTIEKLTGHPTPVAILSAEVPPANIQRRVAATMTKSRMSETKIVETILKLLEGAGG